MNAAILPRVLFIDAYDSFSNNIISLLKSDLNVDVTVIKIDEPIENFALFLKTFSAVVAGPGPGHPENREDVGWFKELWTLGTEDMLPVLGICLGFQSLVLAFGGRVQTLPQPRHGIVRSIRSNGQSLFGGMKNISSVQYHSLYASIERTSEGEFLADITHSSKSTALCPELRPLAYDLEADNHLMDGVLENGNPRAVLMAVAHITKPFCGVQFHPESVCSSAEAQKVISNWWSTAKIWNRMNSSSKTSLNPTFSKTEIETVTVAPALDKVLSQGPTNGAAERSFPSDRSRVVSYANKNVALSPSNEGTPRRSIQLPSIANGSPMRLSCGNGNGNELASYLNGDPVVSTTNGNQPGRPNELPSAVNGMKGISVISRSLALSALTVPDICEKLKLHYGEVVILDSELHQRAEVGTHSIIGIVMASSLKLEYKIGTSRVRHVHGGKTSSFDLNPHGGTIFSYLKSFMKQHKVENGNIQVPFWGGLVGYISYEACLETIDIHANSRSLPNQDLSFVYIERSIVLDHFHQKLHVQSIKSNDQEWVNETVEFLNRVKISANRRQSDRLDASKKVPESVATILSLPKQHVYKSNIRDCQTYIHNGDSYELCLTSESTIRTPENVPAWSLYNRLRNYNSAPFSAYLRLGRLTLLSSSPERFLNWSRPALTKCQMGTSVPDCTLQNYQKKISICEFRPIKGTVSRKPKDPNSLPVSLEQATAILATTKEQAENLMIVDLIRHDLHGVAGAGNVHVDKLMAVEAYATVYQLVTVIRGTLYVSDEEESREDGMRYPANEQTGIDVLAASLPPGSMTGAPKRRSCQLLRGIEGRDRGIYSGVVGYFDVGGGGDFSVVIRSAFRWDLATESDSNGSCGKGDDRGEKTSKHADAGDAWTIGAGGAVTCLSTENGEWEEMRVKMMSIIEGFGGKVAAW